MKKALNIGSKVIWNYDGIYNSYEFYIKEVFDTGMGWWGYSLTDIETQTHNYGGGLIKENELTVIDYSLNEILDNDPLNLLEA